MARWPAGPDSKMRERTCFSLNNHTHVAGRVVKVVKAFYWHRIKTAAFTGLSYGASSLWRRLLAQLFWVNRQILAPLTPLVLGGVRELGLVGDMLG